MAADTMKKLFHLSREQHEILRLAAFDRRRSQSDLMREALDQWIDRQGLRTRQTSGVKTKGASGRKAASSSRH